MSGTTPTLQRRPSQPQPQTPSVQNDQSQPLEQSRYHQTSASPVPPAYNNTTTNYASHPASYTQQTPQPAPQPSERHPNQYTTPHQATFPPQPVTAQPTQYPNQYTSQRASTTTFPPSTHHASSTTGHAPRAIEVFHLASTANDSIPAAIRSQLHQDDQGRVLFFSAPPLDVIAPNASSDGIPLRHTAKYLAAKLKRDALIAERKRKEDEEATKRVDEAPAAKKAKLDHGAGTKTLNQALASLASHIQKGTEELYSSMYAGDAKLAAEAKLRDVERLKAGLEMGTRKRVARARFEEEMKAKETLDLNYSSGVGYLDDVDPRF